VLHSRLLTAPTQKHEVLRHSDRHPSRIASVTIAKPERSLYNVTKSSDRFDLPPDWVIEILLSEQGANKVIGLSGI
jgi:Uma2 family endonuclease